MSDVPHPGPQPPLFSYPFEEARLAATAARNLADDLAQLADRYEQAAAVATVGFRGRTATTFEAQLHETIAGLRTEVAALHAQADQLEADVALARRREEAAAQARADWRQRHETWQQAQRAG
jgi:FtsZ-binding cell division protein ZapB